MDTRTCISFILIYWAVNRGEACRKDNCDSGCEPGYTGDKCGTACPQGSYGKNCKPKCSRGCRDICNYVDGRCNCKPGYFGGNCFEACPQGSYGTDCRNRCRTGCRGTCNSVDGSCNCKPGFTGDNCVERCPQGSYGTDCSSSCSTGCRDTCNSVDGSCNCKPGFTGDNCDGKEQTFGEIKCSADEQGGGNSSSFTNDRACDYSDLNASDISDTLTHLLEDVDDIEEVVYRTVNITTNTTLNQLDVLVITNIMEKTTNISEVSSQVAEGVLSMFSKVSETPDSILAGAQTRADVSNRILRSVDVITGKIDPGPTGTALVSTETFVSQVWDLTNQNVANENLPIGLLLSTSVDNQTDSVYNKSVDYSQTDAAILLPRNFLGNLQNDSEGKDIRMSMNVYKEPLLFTKASTAQAKYQLNSKVVAAKIVVSGVEIVDLGTDSVTMIFSPTKVDTGEGKTCGYWNFSLSGWSTDGCVHSQGESGRDVCTCDHLTNFAVLLNLDGEADENSVHSLPLSVITIIGLSLSILGLSGTLLSFIMFKKLREKHPQQTMFNLALAELCSWIVFLAGITQTQSRVGCTVVAILLHYFLLASFLWMLAEAFLHYVLLVKAQAQGTFTTRYMIKTGVPAWGLPLVPVMIVLAVDPGLYRGSDAHCWMSLTASLYAFALPVGVVILFNITIYIMVVVSVFKISKGRAKGTKGNRQRELLKIRVPVLCFFLFGLSWIFGFLAVSDAKVVFQYLFCLTSSTQGFLIFIFFTARNEEVRQLWSRLCSKKKQDHLIQERSKDLSTSKVPTKTTDC